MSKEIEYKHSLAFNYPDLAKQWDSSKNGTLTPEKVTYGSNKRVWWCLPYDDAETGRHFEFRWIASIKNRTNNTGCPFLSGKAVWPGFNDLASKYPDLAKQWDIDKNGTLTPEKVRCASGKKVWWYLPYDDAETGRHFDFRWKASISGRTYDNLGCPFLSGKAVWPGFNDLASKYPDLAKQWDSSKNGTLTPEKVTYGSKKKVWWYLPYDDAETGRHFDFRWKADINSRTSKNIGCPFLSGKAVWPGFNDLVSRRKYLVEDWNWEKNMWKKPEKLFYNSETKIWWKCHICGHVWRMAVFNRSTRGAGCPKYLRHVT